MMNTLKVWVSVLIPTQGAEVYNGARIQVSLSEDACWKDLWDWLDRPIEAEDAPVYSIAETSSQMEDAIDNREIVFWKVEMQEIALSAVTDAESEPK